MARLIDSDTVSWLPYVKPIRNPYLKIELTKEQKEGLNKWHIWDEPWNEANEILEKEDFLHGILGRRNGKSDALDAMVNTVKVYEKVKEEEMKGYEEIEKAILDKKKRELEDKKAELRKKIYVINPDTRAFDIGVHYVSLEIEKVIFNPPATIVIWSDKTKTVVKCREDDEYDPEYGLAMCIAKKYFGSRHQMQKLVEENYEEPDCTYIDNAIEDHSNALENLKKLTKALNAFSQTLREEYANDAKDENKTADSSVNSGNPDDHWDSDKVWGQTE